jgi:acyl carrier protein
MNSGTSAPTPMPSSPPTSLMPLLTTETVRDLLSDRKIFPGLPTDLDEDAELVLDSLGLIWLLHEMEERYALIVEPTDADIAGLTSLRRITDYLNTAALAQNPEREQDGDEDGIGGRDDER